MFGLSVTLAATNVLAAEAESEISETRVELINALSLEDLINTQVTSVSKRSERLFQSSAAAFVITGDDIRRSGSRSVVEALRMAPGVSVGQIDASTWAVASRGFNDRFTNFLLVMVDGRSVYDPTTSGVFWDEVDYLLEDIDRIEVIRGPGGTLWGANAVNGVINIITKSAKDTVGGLVSGGYGTENRGFTGARYGFELRDDLFARVYVKYHNHDPLKGGGDDWDFFQTGFRSDWERSQSTLTLQGDYHKGFLRQQQVLAFPTPPYLRTFDREFTDTGGNALLRLRHEFSEESDFQIQTYFDHRERHEPSQPFVQDLYDVDFQQRFALPLRQNFMYGIGYRYLPDKFDTNRASIIFDPASRHRQLFSTFVQDEIALVEEHVKLTLGSKFEHNDFTEWELQPSARLAWTPTKRHTLWGAISRAVQLPGRNVEDTVAGFLTLEPLIIDGLPLFVTPTPNEPVKGQELLAYEVGYRWEATKTISLS